MPELIKEVITVFDDSFQPTGNTKFEDWSIHFEMKKLRHELTLTVDGPESGVEAARGCLQTAAGAGLIAAVGTAFFGAGLGATGAAWAAAQEALVSCLGNQYAAKLDDKSHWICRYT